MSDIKVLCCDCGNPQFEIICQPCPGCKVDHVYAVCTNPECAEVICISEDTTIFNELPVKSHNN